MAETHWVGGDGVRVEPIEELIARSSLGGSAWCGVCDHPRDNHRKGLCAYPCSVDPDGNVEWCRCSGFVAMSPEDWLKRRRSGR